MRHVVLIMLVVLGPLLAPAARGQVDPAFYNSSPGAVFRPEQLPVLARALDDESGRLTKMVRLELGETRQGRQLVFRINELRGAVAPLSATLQAGFNDPRALKALNDRASRGLDAVNAELNNPAGTAPGASGIAQRMGRLLFEINRTIDEALASTLPPPPPPGPGGFDPRAVDRQAMAASRAIAASQAVIASDIGSQPPFDGLLRDLDAMTSNVQRIGRMTQAGVPPPQIQAAFDALRARAGQVDARIRGVNLPPRVAGSWAAMMNGLNGLALALQLPADLPVGPVSPPGPVPPPIGPDAGGRVVGLSDQLIGEVDGFIAAVQPTVFRIPQGPQFLNDARVLRNQALGFRQAAASGAGPAQLQPGLQQVEGAFGRLADRINRVAQGRPGPNIDRVRRMSDLVGGIHQIVGP